MSNSNIQTRSLRKQFKVVLLGQSTVGKTSIIQQFVHNIFDHTEQPTVGIDFLSKKINIRGRDCKLQLWDSAGQQKYMSLVASYLRDADCALFVFDLNNSNSLQNLQRWIRLYKESNHMGLAYICGNKSDLQKNIHTNVLNHLINFYKMPYHALSAKTKQNLHELFVLIANALLNKRQSKFNHLSLVLSNEDFQSQATEGGMVNSKIVKLNVPQASKNKQKQKSDCAC